MRVLKREREREREKKKEKERAWRPTPRPQHSARSETLFLVRRETSHVCPETLQASPAGGGPSPAGGGQSPSRDFHKYAQLDHVYSKGLISESKVLPDRTTDHRPVVTTVRARSHGPGMKLVSLKRRNFKASRSKGLRGL
jgi:hypothetical protein